MLINELHSLQHSYSLHNIPENSWLKPGKTKTPTVRWGFDFF